MKLHEHNLNNAPELTPVKMTLRVLLLSDNQLVKFRNDYFDGFMQLERLEVARNRLVAIPSLGWVTFTLKILFLKHNHIISVDGINTQMPFQKLAYLHLNDNDIHEFDVNILSKIPFVIYISLGGNRMRHLDDYRSFVPHAEIQLHGNPFHCDTRTAWISTTVDRFTVKPTCATPWCLKGRNMQRMSKYFNWNLS